MMIVVLKQGASEKQIENLSNWFKAKGVEPDISRGTDITIMGLVGDVSKIDTELICPGRRERGCCDLPKGHTTRDIVHKPVSSLDSTGRRNKASYMHQSAEHTAYRAQQYRYL